MHVHLLNSPVSRGSQCFLISYLVRGQSLWKLCVITQDEQHRTLIYFMDTSNVL